MEKEIINLVSDAIESQESEEQIMLVKALERLIIETVTYEVPIKITVGNRD